MTQTLISEKELIYRCQKNGDLKAFETLIKQNQDKVRAVVYKFTQNNYDLDDISQDVFVKAFKSINKFKGTSSFSTWLYKIAINTCKDKLKSKKVELSKIVNIDDSNFKEIPNKVNNCIEDKINLSYEQTLVFKEINKLPEKQKTALILHDIEEMTYEEISNITETPVGTVKSRLFNARKTLKTALKEILTTIKVS